MAVTPARLGLIRGRNYKLNSRCSNFEALYFAIELNFSHSSDIDKQDSYGKTALHCAVSAGQVNTVKYLLHNHANPNLKDHREEAPLHAAVRTGNVEMVEVIFRAFSNMFGRLRIDVGRYTR